MRRDSTVELNLSLTCLAAGNLNMLEAFQVLIQWTESCLEVILATVSQQNLVSKKL